MPGPGERDMDAAREIHIDGATGSGSGTVVRFATAFAALLGRTLRVTNARVRRPKRGLRAQHVAAVRACAELCAGEVEGVEVGALEFVLRPGERVRGGRYEWDIGSAGKQQLRGGIGVFQGRTPFVWISNNYGGTGVETVSLGCNSAACLPAFNPDPNSQPTSLGSAFSNEIDLIEPDYNYPSLVRGNIAYDRELGVFGLIGSVAGITKMRAPPAPIWCSSSHTVGSHSCHATCAVYWLSFWVSMYMSRLLSWPAYG